MGPDEGKDDAAEEPVTDRLVSVIVPTFEDPRLTGCLEALSAQQLPDGVSVEIVVVDNGSATAPDDLVASIPGARLLVETKRGSYAARNTGVADSRGSVIAFTDSDCRPRPDWIAAALARLDAEPGIDAVAGRVATVVEGHEPRTPAEWWDMLEAFPQERYVRLGFGVTANLVVRRAAGDDVDWFDAEAVSGGDALFGRALGSHGHRLAYEPSAVVEHPARSDWDELLGKARRTAAGWARMEHSRGRTLPEFGRALASHGVALGRTVRTAATSDELPTLSARGRYLAAGVAYRAVTTSEAVRWEVRLRRRKGSSGAAGPS